MTYSDGVCEWELLDDGYFKQLVFTFEDEQEGKIEWITVEKIEEKTVSYVIWIQVPEKPEQTSYNINGQVEYNGVKCNLPSFDFEIEQ